MSCTVWSLDVWGNGKDGYEVNDRSALKRDFKIDDLLFEYIGFNLQASRTFLNLLVNAGYLKKGLHLSSFTFDGSENTIYLNYKNKPLYEIEKNIEY